MGNEISKIPKNTKYMNNYLISNKNILQPLSNNILLKYKNDVSNIYFISDDFYIKKEINYSVFKNSFCINKSLKEKIESIDREKTTESEIENRIKSLKKQETFNIENKSSLEKNYENLKTIIKNINNKNSQILSINNEFITLKENSTVKLIKIDDNQEFLGNFILFDEFIEDSINLIEFENSSKKTELDEILNLENNKLNKKVLETINFIEHKSMNAKININDIKISKIKNFLVITDGYEFQFIKNKKLFYFEEDSLFVRMSKNLYSVVNSLIGFNSYLKVEDGLGIREFVYETEKYKLLVFD